MLQLRPDVVGNSMPMKIRQTLICWLLPVQAGRASNEETTPAPAPALARRGGASRRSTEPALSRAPGPTPAPAPRGTAAARGQQGAVVRSAAATGALGPVPQPAVGSATVTRLAAIRAPTPDIIRAPVPDAPVTKHAQQPEIPAAPVSRTAPTAAPVAATALFVISAKSATVTQLGRTRSCTHPPSFPRGVSACPNPVMSSLFLFSLLS